MPGGEGGVGGDGGDGGLEGDGVWPSQAGPAGVWGIGKLGGLDGGGGPETKEGGEKRSPGWVSVRWAGCWPSR